MANFERAEKPMASGSFAQQFDELEDSNFWRTVPRTRSASISIPMVSMEPYDREASLMGHTGPLRSVRKSSFQQLSAPPCTTQGTGNLLEQRITVRGNEQVENKQETFSNFPANTVENQLNNNNDRKNEHLLRSGQLGMCNDPYCTTCPTYVKIVQQANPRTSKRSDSKFPNVLHGDAKGFARKVYTFFSSCVPGVINPHTKVVQQWNKILASFCMFAIFVDPLFFFILYVHKDDKCISINWNLTTAIISFRSLIDIVYFFNILLQFRLAYVSPESRVVGAGELVDHPTQIARHYFFGYFFLDMIVVIPLPQIIIFFVLPHHLGSSLQNHAKSFLWAAILVQHIPRLFRFLPLLIGQSPTGLIFESGRANFIINLVIVMLTGHVIGSLWYLFGIQRVDKCLQNACLSSSKFTGCGNYIDCECGRLSSHTPSLYEWKHNVNVTACLNATSGAFDYGIFAKAVPLMLKTNVINKYVYSLFWGFQQISTLGGNLTPSDYTWEVIFTIGIIGLGLLLFALLVGNIQNFLQALGRRKLEMQLRGRDVEQWMSHRHLPEDLRRRVRQAERYNWAATRGVNEEVLLESMPEDLQRDIRSHLFKFIKKVRIFALMDEPILDAICERLRQKIYIKGSNILYQGGLVEKMVFVVRGKLESIGEDGTRVSLSEGDACGEELLRWYLEHSSVSKDGRKVRLPGQRLLCNRTVKCLTNVEAFSLRAADLEEVTILFTRFLRSSRVQGALRYESPYWRSLAATRIQVAWRYRKKKLNRSALKSD